MQRRGPAGNRLRRVEIEPRRRDRGRAGLRELVAGRHGEERDQWFHEGAVKLDSLVCGTEAGTFRLLNFSVLHGSGDDAAQFAYA
jgi:hypothetical protein